MQILTILLLVGLVTVDGAIPNKSDFALKYHNTEYTYYSNVTTASSRVECATLCHQKLPCHSFQYNRNTGRCATHPVSFEARWEFEAEHQIGNDVYIRTNSQALGSSCSGDSGCAVVNSVCYFGSCACDPGYSFHQSNNTCVRHCDQYGTEMTFYPGLGIAGNNLFLVYDKSVEECAHACVSETSSQCLTFDYNPVTRHCALAPVGYLDVAASGRIAETPETSLWQMGTRDCAP